MKDNAQKMADLFADLERAVSNEPVLKEVLGDDVWAHGGFTVCTVRNNYGKTIIKAYLKYQDGTERDITLEQYEQIQSGTIKKV